MGLLPNSQEGICCIFQIVGYLIHRTTQCLLNSIPLKLKSSTFVLLVVKLVPLLLRPPRSVHWVCHPKRSVKILPRPLKTGKVRKSRFSSQSRIVKPPSQWCHQPLPWSLRQTKNGLIITVILGIYFTILQGLEYYEARFTFADRIY